MLLSLSRLQAGAAQQNFLPQWKYFIFTLSNVVATVSPVRLLSTWNVANVTNLARGG